MLVKKYLQLNFYLIKQDLMLNLLHVWLTCLCYCHHSLTLFLSFTSSVSFFGTLAYGTILCQFSSVQSLSCVQLFVTPGTAAHQASLSITNFWSLLKLMSIESVMPSNHLILCCSLLLLLQSFPESGSFPVSQLFTWGGKVSEFQLQHQSFQ